MAARYKKPNVTKADQVTARIRVLVSFNGMYAGDEADIVIDKRVQGWINAHVVEVLSTNATEAPQDVELPEERVTSDGAVEAGQSGSEPADPGSEPERASGGWPTAREPSARARARGHGTSAREHP